MGKIAGLVAAFAGAVALAQTDAGSLGGEVTDASGGVVADAKVQVTAKSTGAVRSTVSNAAGRYQFPLLAPGVYSIRVEATGFKRFVDSEVPVPVAQAALLDVRLEVGAVAETVEVSGTASVLNVESVSQGTVITGEKIVSLPLNGRQFIQLALLVPSANAGGRQVQQNTARLNQTGGLSSSGGRTNNNLFLFDGVNNTDPDYNALSYVPIVDSLAEFQVQGAQYSARYGRASGAQINVVTRAGSNEFHGAAWEFLRNQATDARPFNLLTSELPKNQRNQFGVTVGGPMKKNRVFFFGAYEALRLRQAGVGITTVTVPTALERNGDFSQSSPAAYDPTLLSSGVRQPFPDNQIPRNRLNAVTLAAIRAMPLPNVGARNFINASATLKQDSDNGSLRGDWVATRRVNVFARYSASGETSVTPDVVPARDRLGEVRPQNVMLGATMILSPSRVNELRAGYNRLVFQDGLPEPVFDVNGSPQTIPRFRPTGFPAMGGAGAFTGTTGGGTVLVRNNSYQIYDNFSWIRGAHSLAFGGELQRLDYNRSEAAAPLGDFQFTQGYTSRTASNDGTGNALATMLLALPSQGNRQITPTRLDGRQYAYSVYAQDDWRVSARLTVNAGIRYEISPPMYDTRQQAASIDFSKVPWPTAIFRTGPLATLRPTLFTCGLGGTPKGCAYTDANNFAPRLGLVFRLTARTVLRAGGGIFYALTDSNGLLQLARGLPANVSQTINATSAFVPSLQGFDIFGPAAQVGTVAISRASLDLNQRTSYSPQISVSIQRELARGTVLEASYLGTFGIKLQQNVQPNNAQPGAGAVDPRRPYAGLTLDPSMVFPYYITVVNRNVPATQLNMYALSAQSNYHALLLRFERRFAAGFSMLSSYTYSKAITNAPQFRNAGGANGSENSPAQDTYNLKAERGLASFDTRQRWVSTAVWDLPFGARRKYLTHGLASAILGGWQLSGILQLQSGFPFTINLTGDTAGIGGGTGGILVRPNAVPGQNYRLDSNVRTTDRWFNTAAFATPPAFQFGNVGRNTVVGPNLMNLDASVARSIRINERVGLQLRVEFFNALNHPNYNLVGRIINDPSTFGKVQNQLPPRQLQAAVKLAF